MIRGRVFSEMIRIQARKSELQAKSQSCGPKVRVTAGQTPRIRTESPRKGPRMGFMCIYREAPLKAFLNPPKLLVLLSSLLSCIFCINVPQNGVGKRGQATHFLFRSLFGNLVLVFGHFLVIFLSRFWLPFRLSPSAYLFCGTTPVSSLHEDKPIAQEGAPRRVFVHTRCGGAWGNAPSYLLKPAQTGKMSKKKPREVIFARVFLEVKKTPEN